MSPRLLAQAPPSPEAERVKKALNTMILMAALFIGTSILLGALFIWVLL